MATTQCLRVALFVPLTAPMDGDVVQVQTAATFLTSFTALPTGGGATLPTPTKEGDVMQADAALVWVAVPVDGGAS